ncbi:MAG TPA: hypothetical protein VFP30_04505 [Candidatus Limnocylindria bacterium]|nr:hypothetical protein [Candidatus Limnocylindria bacterium]
MITRSISTGAVLAAAFFAIVVLVRTTLPLLDGDVWWHLRAGEAVLHEGAVPAVNSWTIAGAGLPWISQDWMSNVLMAWLFGADEQWGATLLSLAFGAIAVAAFLVLWGAIGRRRPSASTLSRVVLFSAGLIVAAPVLGVRVQTVDLLMIALTIGLLWGYLSDRGVRWLIGLPVLTVVWANTHAGWPLLFALGGAVIVGESLDRVLGRRVGNEPLSWVQIAALAGSLGACVPALLLNPNGARLLTYPFATASIQAHRDFLFEWSPPDISTFPGQALVAFLVMLVLPTLVLGQRHLRAAEMLWLGGLSVLSLSAIRFVIAIGPAGAAIAAVALVPALTERGWLAGSLASIFDRPPKTRRLGMTNLTLAALMVLFGVGVATARVAPPAQESAIAEAMPVEATAFVAAERPSARIFNVYAWGGYIGRELPNSVVYIDGRSDIYGDGPIREYAEAIALERDPFEILDRDDIDVVLFWPEAPLSMALDRHALWRRIYDDPQAAVWVRETGE